MAAVTPFALLLLDIELSDEHEVSVVRGDGIPLDFARFFRLLPTVLHLGVLLVSRSVKAIHAADLRIMMC